VILIRDNSESREISTRIEITKTKILNEKAGKVLELWSRGKGKLARMLSTLYMGDFVSVYLAILYGFDPTPVNVINDIKTYVKEKADTTNRIKRRFKELMLH
jgi:glucose/mannose-6-phosphate isomerase